VNVLAVPNDAVRNTREAVATAPLLGLDPDSVQAQLRAQLGGRRAGGDGGRTAAPGVRQQGEQGRQSRGLGGRQQIDVSDQQCADVRTALARRPAERRKLDELQTRMRAADADRMTVAGEMRAIYQAVGVDARVAMACRRREQNAADGAGRTGAAAVLTTPTNGAAADPNAPPARIRPGLVFVAEGNTFKPRVVMLGAGNYDFTEVVSGLKEGEHVALLASLAVQAQREEQNERFRSRAGGIPGMQQGGGGGPRGGGGRGGAGPR
jgi:hypothetical protein